MAHTQSVALAETQDPALADIDAGHIRIGGHSVETAVPETAVPKSEAAVADTMLAETTIAETRAIGSTPVGDRKSTRLNSSHSDRSRMPSSA